MHLPKLLKAIECYQKLMRIFPWSTKKFLDTSEEIENFAKLSAILAQ